MDQRGFDSAEAVEVLDFHDGRPNGLVGGVGNFEVHVGVAAEAALLHVAVRDAQIDHQQSDLLEVPSGLGG